MHHDDPRLQRVIDFFEQLQPADLARLGTLYADEARFKDPFNEVRGVAAVRGIFEHMFASVQAPRFVVLTALAQGDQAFLTWDFHFATRGRPLRIHGGSHLVFAADGRVALHRDYWDAAEELYEKLPVVGGLMRWLKRRANS